MFIKYTKKKYLDKMLNNGSIYINMYWNYRANENQEIGDHDEGQSGFIFRNDTNKPWEITPELLDTAAMSSEGHPRFTESKVLNPGEESLILATGGFNTYMYSLTKADAPSKKLMKKLGYDAAVEILDINAFANHTAKALRQHLTRNLGVDRLGATRLRCVFNSVKYVQSKRRIVTPSTINILKTKKSLDINEFFTKVKRFDYQSEFRIAYFMMNPQTEKFLSLDLTFPELRPVIIGDASNPRIAPKLRRIKASEFKD